MSPGLYVAVGPVMLGQGDWHYTHPSLNAWSPSDPKRKVSAYAPSKRIVCIEKGYAVRGMHLEWDE
jgi:hypothetical protein